MSNAHYWYMVGPETGAISPWVEEVKPAPLPPEIPPECWNAEKHFNAEQAWNATKLLCMGGGLHGSGK
jgi:hypothetical protein